MWCLGDSAWGSYKKNLNNIVHAFEPLNFVLYFYDHNIMHIIGLSATSPSTVAGK